MSARSPNQPSDACITRTERRSPDRLRFVQDWRRSFGADEASASVEEIDVAVWVGSPSLVNASRSARNVLSIDDRLELGLITETGQRDIAQAARIVLRIALSAATQGEVAAAAWRFERRQDGKSIICEGQPTLAFSVSHCASAVAVAVSTHTSVGVDVESVDETFAQKAKNAFLTDRERMDVAKLSAAQQARECVRLWTMKEALFKSLKDDHPFGLDTLNFSLRTSPEPSLPNLQAGSVGHFETMYVAVPDDLCLTSLAIPAVVYGKRHGVIQLVKAQSGQEQLGRGLLPS